MKKMLMSAKEVAEVLSLAKSTIYAYADKGILKAVYMPSIAPSQAKKQNRKAVRFRVDEVEKFLNSLSGN
jgi:predicted DNA-binding transcriptional regulator AlpA